MKPKDRVRTGPRLGLPSLELCTNSHVAPPQRDAGGGDRSETDSAAVEHSLIVVVANHTSEWASDVVNQNVAAPL